jgi:DNA-directed RNA polymerase subunit N
MYFAYFKQVSKTIIPVRCFTCGKVGGHLWEEFKRRKEAGEDAGKVMDELGLKRYCCRQLFLGHVDLLKEVAKFKL